MSSRFHDFGSESFQHSELAILFMILEPQARQWIFCPNSSSEEEQEAVELALAVMTCQFLNHSSYNIWVQLWSLTALVKISGLLLVRKHGGS